MNRNTSVRPLLYSLLLANAVPLSAENWPQWRGETGMGHATTRTVTKFGETENLQWKTSIPGRGYSSPVVWGDQIWLTTAIEKPADAATAKERLKKNTGDQPVTVMESVSLRAVGIDRKSGHILHDFELLSPKEPQWVHQLNSYASPTPVIEEGRLYTHFGAYGTACVDTKKGEVLWKNTDTYIMHENGPGSSPVLFKNLLIFHCDGSDEQYIIALDKNTGKTAWKTPRTGQLRENAQMRKAYGTPLIVEHGGTTLLVSTGADWLYGYDPLTGKELWKLSYGILGFSMSPRPVFGNGMVYFSTSFSPPTIMAVKLNGDKTPEIAWTAKKNAPNIPSPLLVENHLYYVNDNGIFSCLDAHSGQEIYRERINGQFTASPMKAGDVIYTASRGGAINLLKIGKTFEIQNTVQLDGGVYCSPVVVDGELIIRTDRFLYSFAELRK